MGWGMGQHTGGNAFTDAFRDISSPITSGLDALNTFGQGAVDMITGKKKPGSGTGTPQAAATTTPTQEQVAPGVINAQVQEQRQRARASTLLTGGQGSLDEPRTASTTLLGI